MTKRRRLHRLPPFLLVIFCLISCGDEEIDPIYKERMREFVISISDYAKTIHPGFLIIPQNGIELVTDDGEETGSASTLYLAAIDANGQEDLYYGYSRDDVATPLAERSYLINFLNISKDSGNNVILVTDYCYSHSNITDSYSKNLERGFVSFAATHRELDNIPSNPAQPHLENDSNITEITQVKNFLYMINPSLFSSKEELIQTLATTNYDLFIMDLFFSEEMALTADDIMLLKTKANGGSRLVVAYMSIGEAEDYRYYWDESWLDERPEWLDKENKQWEGNYKVKYWNEEWQAIIYGNDLSYTKKILDAGFDGVYLDIIEAFEHFE